MNPWLLLAPAVAVSPEVQPVPVSLHFPALGKLLLFPEAACQSWEPTPSPKAGFPLAEVDFSAVLLRRFHSLLLLHSSCLAGTAQDQAAGIQLLLLGHRRVRHSAALSCL